MAVITPTSRRGIARPSKTWNKINTGRIFCKLIINKKLSQLTSPLIFRSQNWRGAIPSFKIKPRTSTARPICSLGLAQRLPNNSHTEATLWIKKYLILLQTEKKEEKRRMITNLIRLSSKATQAPNRVNLLSPIIILKTQAHIEIMQTTIDIICVGWRL